MWCWLARERMRQSAASKTPKAGKAAAKETGLRLATFDVDATPPVGSAMAYDPVKRLDELTLRCRGIVLLGADKPIVLCCGRLDRHRQRRARRLSRRAGRGGRHHARSRGRAHPASARRARLRFHGRAAHPRAGAEGLWPLRGHLPPAGHPAARPTPFARRCRRRSRSRTTAWAWPRSARSPRTAASRGRTAGCAPRATRPPRTLRCGPSRRA